MSPHSTAGLLEASSWSLTTGQIGSISILAALGSFIGCAITSYLNKAKLSRGLYFGGILGILISFGALVTLTVNQQYQFMYVWKHGQNDLELQYRISQAWAGQEGSFLLWAVTSGLTSIFLAKKTGTWSKWYLIICSAILAALCGILSFESPFNLIPFVDGKQLIPPDGKGLSPSLINYWMVIHPPTMFIGFGSLMPLFALALGGLASKNHEDWLEVARSLGLFALGTLGLGLCMGGFWAYETLNWGGFWAWDPVENTSFVPWAFVAAFIHGIFMQKAKRGFQFTNLLLAMLPFGAFCYGTFMTRSGYLGDSSVHSFAQMNRSALQILLGLVTVTAFGSTGYWLFSKLKAAKPETLPVARTPWSKQFGYPLSIWLLIAFAIIAAVGMSVPLIQSVTGGKPAMVKEVVYHNILMFFFPFLMMALGIYPWLSWKEIAPREMLRRVNVSLAITTFFTGMLLVLVDSPLVVPRDMSKLIKTPFNNLFIIAAPWVLILSWLCLFGIVSNLFKAFTLRKTGLKSIGGLVTHVGLSMTMLGLIFSRGFERKEVTVLNADFPKTVLGHTFAVLDKDYNWADRNNKIDVVVTGPQGTYNARPGLYFVPGEKEPMPVMWPAIEQHLFYDLHINLYPPTEGNEATGETEFAVGDERAHEGILLKFIGLKTEGNLGMAGAKFIAELEYDSPWGDGILTPSIKLTEDGAVFEDARVSDKYSIRLTRMDAATKNAYIVIRYQKPAYPVEIFYKPLTRFVWFGVGIMTLGALWSALYRRPSVLKERDRTLDEPSSEV